MLGFRVHARPGRWPYQQHCSMHSACCCCVTSLQLTHIFLAHGSKQLIPNLPRLLQIGDMGYLRFYLAPKIEDEDMEGEDEAP